MTLQIELFDWSTTNVRVNFHPFHIVPYEQWLAFVRPDALTFGNDNEWAFIDIKDVKQILEEGLDVYVGGTYSVELLKVNLEYTQNGKYLRKSLISPFLKDSTDSIWFKNSEFAYKEAR